MRTRPALQLALATAAILAVTLLPVGGYAAHAHWGRVQWVPFGESSVPPFGALANVMLFAPFGWALARMTTARAWPLAILVSAALSSSVELAQVFAHGRYPTVTDVALNVLGAAIGAAIARRC